MSGDCFADKGRLGRVHPNPKEALTMRCNQTTAILCFLLVSLFVPAGHVPAQTVGVQVQLDRLASEIEQEGYSYRVADNPAMSFSLDQICGLVVPDNWEAEVSFHRLESLGALPPSFDWRDAGLPPVRNQGGCGSCWAFATVGALESQIAIQSGTAQNLSEQYLVSCNESGWDCGGGWWAHDYHEWRIPAGESEAGAVLEADFPYQASNVPCNPPHSHPYRIDGWAYVPGNEDSVEEIKQAIYQYGPVAAGVAVGPAFHAYSEGVFDNDESDDINHAIVLVGWDDAYFWEGNTYGVWILRNSWGSGWGEDGYMYIAYGTSRVGYSANYVEYASVPEFALTAPADGASASSPPVFSWTGSYEYYLFYSVFPYDLVYWRGYRTRYFWTVGNSFAMPSNWWNKIDGSTPSYWTVCGYDGDMNCSPSRSFTKNVAVVPGD